MDYQYIERLELLNHNNSFRDPSVRRAFIRKVFGLLMCQMLCTLAVMIWGYLDFYLTLYLYDNKWIPYSFMFAMVVISGTIVLYHEYLRRAPYNIIMLVLLTVSLCGVMAFVSGSHTIVELMFSFAVSTISFLAVILFACQSKFEFNFRRGALLVTSIPVCVFVPLGFIMPWAVLHLVFCGLLTTLFSLYLIYDTQHIINNQSYVTSPKEYIYAVLVLYLDIVRPRGFYAFDLKSITQHRNSIPIRKCDESYPVYTVL